MTVSGQLRPSYIEGTLQALATEPAYQLHPVQCSELGPCARELMQLGMKWICEYFSITFFFHTRNTMSVSVPFNFQMPFSTFTFLLLYQLRLEAQLVPWTTHPTMICKAQQLAFLFAVQ